MFATGIIVGAKEHWIAFFYFIFFIVATTAKMDVRLFFHLVLN